MDDPGPRQRLLLGVVAAGLLLVHPSVEAVRTQAAVSGQARPDAAAGRQLLAEGRYAQAAALAEALRDIASDASGAESLEVAAADDLLVEALFGAGAAREPRVLASAENALRLKRRAARPDPAVAVSLHNLGMVRLERGELPAARRALEDALAIRRNAAATDAALLGDTLDQLALVSIRAERWADAERRVAESLKLRSGADARRSGRTLYLLALLHRQQGRYAEAAAALDRARDAMSPLRADHPDRIAIAELQGDLLLLNGLVAAAHETWTNAAALAERELGPDHPSLSRLHRVRGLARLWDGRFGEARAHFEAAEAVARRRLAEYHEENGALQGSAALLAAAEGDYVTARRLQSDALALHQRCLGATHSLTVTAIHNLADVALQTGDLAEAERLHSRAVQLWTQGLDARHPYVARGLDALAEVVALRGDHRRARSLYERALTLRRQSLTGTHPDVAWTLTNLARTNAALGNLTRASTQIEEAIGIYESGGASQSSDFFARALVFRADIQMRQSRPGAARGSLARALELRERTFGLRHALTVEARAAMASAQAALGAGTDALALALAAEADGRDQLRSMIRYLPERQALGYAATRARSLDVALSVLVSATAAPSDDVFDAVVRSRAVLLDEFAARTRVESAGDPALEALSRAVAAARQRFAMLNYRVLRGDESVSPEALARAQRDKEDAERRLAERSAPLQRDLARAAIGLEEVRRSLPPTSALVSFVRYERLIRDAEIRRVPSFVAFVLRADSPTPHVVPLGPASALEAAIDAWRAEATGRSAAAAAGPRAAEQAYRRAGTELRTRVWDPIASSLSGLSRVLIVPDGMINLVAFGALPVGTDRYLVETGQSIHYLTAERDLVPLDDSRPGEGLLAVGGASFGTPSRASAAMAQRSGCPVPAAALQFEPLPMSQREAEDVARLWMAGQSTTGARAFPGDATLLAGNRATQQAVADAMRGRRIVHLATHGFFLDEACRSATATGTSSSPSGFAAISAENPLLLSGLALSPGPSRGGNTADDGILTAEEVAGLNLTGTDWVVLSACDTGVGRIRDGEGVLGLRRAFQIAGARTIVMSLWSVQDQATRTWMLALYEARLVRGESTDQAVASASIEVLRQRRSRNESTHPFFWAAFVAAGDWQ